MSAIYKNFRDPNSEVETLFSLGFKDCLTRISKMDTMKKAEIVSQITPILENLYATANRYGNKDFSRDEQISPEIFRHIMSKIKRWEIILGWLFEVDIMMEQADLNALILEAEDALRQTSDKALAKIKLETLKADRVQVVVHTDDIMALAQSLTASYFTVRRI